MNVIAMTMVYNEGRMLGRWLNHYGRHLGPKNLLVLDHGSDDGSTSSLGQAGSIAIPRDAGFDDGTRAEFVSQLQSALLKFYDVVIYTDADEFLIPDPRRYSTLSHYLSAVDAECIRPVGLEMFHHRAEEPPLDGKASVLSQRNYCRFYSDLCKPLVTRVPVRWVAGFHACSNPAKIDPELLLIHLKNVDYDAAMERAYITRSLKWSDRAIEAGWGKRHRASDEELTRNFFDGPCARLTQNGASELQPGALAQVLNADLSHAHGVWRFEPRGGDVFYRIPSWLRASL